MNEFKIINISFIEKEKLLFDIMELWNHEVDFIFPFYRDLLVQKTFECPFFDMDSSFLIYNGDKLVGFVIGKIYNNNEIMSKYINTGWISLIYISKKYRRQGLGSMLLKKTEKELLNKRVQKIMIGADYNNFFPGIPNDFLEMAEPFFIKNGYVMQNTDYDVIRKFIKKEEVFVSQIQGFEIRYANLNDKHKVLNFFQKNFYGRWYYEALEYFDDMYEDKTYLIVLKDNIVVGFIRINRYNSKKISYNVNWNKSFERLYGFGPLGVDKEYRGNGLARLLIETAIRDSVNEGATDIIIDWTSLVKFYEKFYFKVWKSYKHGLKIIFSEKNENEFDFIKILQTHTVYDKI